MHYTWLFLVVIRDFSVPFGIPSIALTAGINALLFLNFIIDLQMKHNFKIKKILLIIIPYLALIIFNKGFLGWINILLCGYILTDVKIEKIVLFNTFILILSILVLFLGISAGYISNEMGGAIYEDGKYAFGFRNNANMPSGICFQLLVLLYYLGCRYKIILLHIMCVILLVLANIYTGGRTYIYSGVLLFIFGVFFSNYKLVKKIRPILFVVPLLSIPFIYFMIAIMANPEYAFIDVLLSGRPFYYREFFREFSVVNLFVGMPIPEGVILDQLYINLLATGGITAIMIFYFLYAKFVKNINAKKGYIVAIVLAYLFSGFFECAFTGITAASLPLFWLLFYKSAYGKNKVLA